MQAISVLSDFGPSLFGYSWTYSQIGSLDNLRFLVVHKIVITCVLDLQIGSVTSCELYNIYKKIENLKRAQFE